MFKITFIGGESKGKGCVFSTGCEIVVREQEEEVRGRKPEVRGPGTDKMSVVFSFETTNSLHLSEIQIKVKNSSLKEVFYQESHKVISRL